jgi:hypothetical protein
MNNGSHYLLSEKIGCRPSIVFCLVPCSLSSNITPLQVVIPVALQSLMDSFLIPLKATKTISMLPIRTYLQKHTVIDATTLSDIDEWERIRMLAVEGAVSSTRLDAAIL